jgi:hypothetical protein
MVCKGLWQLKWHDSSNQDVNRLFVDTEIKLLEVVRSRADLAADLAANIDDP